MSEDLTESILKLANGVSLTYPSSWQVKEVSITLSRVNYNTTPPTKESIVIGFEQCIGGKTSHSFSADGLPPVLSETLTGHSSGLTSK